MRPFPTPLTAKFLPSHASDKWGPRGLLKKNAITCVCALLPAARLPGAQAGSPPKQPVLGALRGGWDVQRARGATPCTITPTSNCFLLGCPSTQAGAGSAQVLCPATAFSQQAQGFQSRDSELSRRDSFLSPALFISD